MYDYGRALQKRIDDWGASTGRPYLVLGHDVGVASDGFCLLDLTNHKVLEMGSRLFDAPQEPKTRRSLAAVRSERRRSRRNTRRTRDRLRHCLGILKDHGLVPADETAEWLRLREGDVPTIWLRARALDERVSDRELAQVLYTLCKRRGYIDHGRDDDAGDKDAGKVKAAIVANQQEMAEGGWRTVGEMLAARGRDRNKAGDYSLMVTIGQVEEEARAILTSQRELGNTHVTDVLVEDYVACLTWQVPAGDRDRRSYEAVGGCTYYPDLKRAARADPSSELCAALESYHNVVIVAEDGTETRLAKDRITRYVASLFTATPTRARRVPGITYETIRADLGLPPRARFKGVGVDEERDREPYRPKAWNILRQTYPAEVLEALRGDRGLGDAVCEALTYASGKESLRERLGELVGTPGGHALGRDVMSELVEEGPYGSKAFKSYGSRSLKALGQLIDAFQDPAVVSLADAERSCGLDEERASRQADRSRSTALPPFAAWCPDCRNPVVLRASAQVRRVTNAIMRRYGVPNEIHIGLARELKASMHERQVSAKRKNSRERTNRATAEEAGRILGCAPDEVSGRLLLKMALHQEQGGIDPYTGLSIDLARLVTDEAYCQVDYILPRARTCDDSRDNKVLTLTGTNQAKGARTPYEWMASGEGAPDWEAFRSRVCEGCRNPRKRARLLNTCLDEVTEDAFIGRNLSDTRYMSRLFKDWFEDNLLWPDDGQKAHVVAVAGGATASLRHAWGLNRGDGDTKDRGDARHHAIDAAVIAACSRATVTETARLRERGRRSFEERRDTELVGSQPWAGFANTVLACHDTVVPTRAVDHGLSGCMYDDTLYRFVGRDSRGYPLLARHGGVPVVKGNVHVFDDGSARAVSSLAFVRLWLDPDGRGGRGKWYLEPVYCSDIPRALGPDYPHGACKGGVPRDLWQPVPEACLERRPIRLFPGDVLVVGDHVARFVTVDIYSCSLMFRNVLDDARRGPRAKDFPTLGRWDGLTEVRVLEQDCLGHCWRAMRLSRGTTAYVPTS